MRKFVLHASAGELKATNDRAVGIRGVRAELMHAREQSKVQAAAAGAEGPRPNPSSLEEASVEAGRRVVVHP